MIDFSLWNHGSFFFPRWYLSNLTFDLRPSSLFLRQAVHLETVFEKGYVGTLGFWEKAGNGDTATQLKMFAGCGVLRLGSAADAVASDSLDLGTEVSFRFGAHLCVVEVISD